MKESSLYQSQSGQTARAAPRVLEHDGGPGLASARTATPPPPGHRVYSPQAWLDINRWKCPFYNDGRYGIDVTIGTGQAGGSWPQPLHNCYLFGAGLWFGSTQGRQLQTRPSWTPRFHPRI